MEHIALTLARLEQPTKTSQASIEPAFDWKWELVGNETIEESLILSRMLSEAKRFCADMVNGKEPRWISFVGASGCGKTYLARQVCEFVGKYGEMAFKRIPRNEADPDTCWAYAQEGQRFKRWIKLLEVAREGDFIPAKKAGRDWFKCVDDIGSEGKDTKGEAYSFASNLLGKLCDDRVGRWTVFTSNFTRRQIAERYDPRVASRLSRDGGIIVDASTVRDYQIRKETA